MKLWVDGARLRYTAPAGTLGASELRTLQTCKADLIDLLTAMAHQTVPLTYAQQWLWNTLELYRHSFRTANFALRLTGHLDIDLLHECLSQLAKRHDALRTRLTLFNDTPVQSLDDAIHYRLEPTSLTFLPGMQREAAAQRLIREFIATPVYLTRDPLFAFRLLKLDEEEHVLAAAMEHLVCDGVSTRLIQQELLELYGRSVQNQSHLFQFLDYARAGHNTPPAWVESNATFWEQKLVGARRARIFPGPAGGHSGQPRMGAIQTRLNTHLTAGLREVSRRSGTSLSMSVLAAFAALLLRWSEATDVVISFITRGRTAETESTIGHFVFPLLIRVRLTHSDTFPDLLKNVTDDYAQAYEHIDWGRLAARLPTPEIFCNPCFNWFPGELPLAGYPPGVSSFSVPDPQGDIEWDYRLDTEPVLYIADAGEEIVGGLTYIASVVSRETAERFEQSFRQLVAAVVAEPTVRVAEVSLR